MTEATGDRHDGDSGQGSDEVDLSRTLKSRRKDAGDAAALFDR
jgi:hypothetical protein